MADTTYNIRPSSNGNQHFSNPMGDYVSVERPTALAASVVGATVTLTFTDNTGGDGQHVVFRSSSGTPSEQIGTLGAGVTSFQDIGRPAGVWLYAIKALDNGSFSALSEIVQADVIGGSTQLTHGSTFTIVGTGFGTNSATTNEFLGGAAGIFEQGGIGTTPAKTNWDFESQWHNGVIYEDAERGKVLWTRISNQNGDKRFDNVDYIPESTPYMLSYWVKNISFMDGATIVQWKMTRFGYANNINDNDSEITFFNWQGSSKQVMCRYNAVSNPTLSPGSAAGPVLDGGWTKMQWFINPGTQGSANGELHLRTKRPGQPWHTWSRTDQQVYGTANRHRYFIIQNYFGNYSGAGAGRYQDIFEDDFLIQVGSWKRVELCNSANYTAAEIREDQPWTYWSDGAIQITVNKGGLPPGQYYLHVLDGLNTSVFSQEVTLTA